MTLTDTRYFFERGTIADALPPMMTCSEICRLDPKHTQLTYGDNEDCIAQIASTLNDAEKAIEHARMNVKIFEEYKFEGGDLQHKWRLC